LGVLRANLSPPHLQDQGLPGAKDFVDRDCSVPRFEPAASQQTFIDLSLRKEHTLFLTDIDKRRSHPREDILRPSFVDISHDLLLGRVPVVNFHQLVIFEDRYPRTLGLGLASRVNRD